MDAVHLLVVKRSAQAAYVEIDFHISLLIFLFSSCINK